jgi:hypothetical protein
MRFLIEREIIKTLNQEIREDGNEYNTDGIINVALFLADCINKGWIYGEMERYIDSFIPLFEKYIESQSNVSDKAWNGKANKDKHIKAYKDILARITKVREILG